MNFRSPRFGGGSYYAKPKTSGNFRKIVDLFNAAKTKLERPSLRITVEGVGFYIYPAGVDSKNRGFLYVKRGENYLGKIAPNGDYIGDVDFVSYLSKINEDPIALAAMQGKETKHCCFCGLLLENPSSVFHGYGPICAANWGLPWGDVPEPKPEELFTGDELSVLAENDADAEFIYNTDYCAPAMYVAQLQLQEEYCQPQSLVPISPYDMADCIMQEFYNITNFTAYPESRKKLRDAIVQLLAQHPILKE